MAALLRVAIACAGLLLALPAQASPLDDAKRAGQVGEQADGFVALVPGAPASNQALVDRINAERAKRYAEIATRNDTSPTAVAALAGEKLIERAAPGEWVRDAEGTWRRRESTPAGAGR